MTDWNAYWYGRDITGKTPSPAEVASLQTTLKRHLEHAYKGYSSQAYLEAAGGGWAQDFAKTIWTTKARLAAAKHPLSPGSSFTARGGIILRGTSADGSPILPPLQVPERQPPTDPRGGYGVVNEAPPLETGPGPGPTEVGGPVSQVVQDHPVAAASIGLGLILLLAALVAIPLLAKRKGVPT